MEYEYGIIYKSDEDSLKSKYPEIHRFGYTKEEAENWISEWIEMGGKSNTYKIIRRPVCQWEVV